MTTSSTPKTHWRDATGRAPTSQVPLPSPGHRPHNTTKADGEETGETGRGNAEEEEENTGWASTLGNPPP
ncbi:hypothetical protein Taro_033285 [Colocasia esculenta]|uniref:Uncharacterized protein n=1 Tax=Colocasia esculenta TaxID=4460 RepID=A0A843W4C4_COLES|nr:hypothetical protein [Colocasia esculenta]